MHRQIVADPEAAGPSNRWFGACKLANLEAGMTYSLRFKVHYDGSGESSATSFFVKVAEDSSMRREATTTTTTEGARSTQAADDDEHGDGTFTIGLNILESLHASAECQPEGRCVHLDPKKLRGTSISASSQGSCSKISWADHSRWLQNRQKAAARLRSMGGGSTGTQTSAAKSQPLTFSSVNLSKPSDGGGGSKESEGEVDELSLLLSETSEHRPTRVAQLADALANPRGTDVLYTNCAGQKTAEGPMTAATLPKPVVWVLQRQPQSMDAEDDQPLVVCWNLIHANGASSRQIAGAKLLSITVDASKPHKQVIP